MLDKVVERVEPAATVPSSVRVGVIFFAIAQSEPFLLKLAQRYLAESPADRRAWRALVAGFLESGAAGRRLRAFPLPLPPSLEL